MSAVPIYVWNGSAWQETGPTIPASPIAYQASAPSSPSTGDIWVDSDGDVTTGSQQFQRFRFVASGGETTISGADADGAILAYTAGLEQVILNGAVLVRGQDYTATDGTNITGLSPALVASDVLEVFSFIAFTVANTYTQSQVDGLVNAARAASGLVLLNTTSFSGVASQPISNVFSSTYDNYLINGSILGSTNIFVNLRYRTTSDDTSSNYYWQRQGITSAGALTNGNGAAVTFASICPTTTEYYGSFNLGIFNPNLSRITTASGTSFGLANDYTNNAHWHVGHIMNTTTAYTGFTLLASTGTITGSVSVYGYNKQEYDK